MTRYCPKCGEPVPSNCITCPKCYAKIPVEPAKKESNSSYDQGGKPESSWLERNRFIVTIVPALIGFLGVYQILTRPKWMLGYVLLILGLLFFWVGNMLLFSFAPDFIVAVFKNLSALGCLFIYFIMFIINFVTAMSTVSVVRY